MFSRWLHIDTSKSALIIGPRRSGKTTYLRQLFPDIPYITLDDLDAYEWAQQDPKGFIAHLGKRAIIDEIQRLPILTIAVKYAIDNEGATFYMTGSSTIGLLDSAADSLAGRLNIYHFPTPCWGENLFGTPSQEWLTGTPLPPRLKQGSRTLPDACQFGSFPEVVAAQDAAQKDAILKNYKNTYFTRDLMQLANIENLDGILAIYHHLIRSIGSHLEVASFAKESGLSVPTAKKYLNALYQSELCFKLHGYQYGPAKRYIKAAKSYFADNGIIKSFNTMASEGQLVENFVISELEKRRKLGLINCDALYYYKTSSGREIDVIFEEGAVLTAIEIKATHTINSRDIRNLIEFKASLDRPCRLIAYYLGDVFSTQNDVEIRPVASLFG